jgi:hypothetical protein
MPAELDQMNPDMDQDAHDYSQPDGGHDREGAMAKADLYKLATYSHKLFKQLHDNDQMEAWVQAKITKAADYIASVYHYLEYEMKFSEYGHHLDNSDTLSEGQKMKIKEVLAEAKEKMKELKKSQAEKMTGKKVEEGILSGGDRPCTECGGTGMVYEEPKEVPAHVKNKVDAYKRLTKATHAAHKRLDANNNGIPDDEEMDEEFTDKSKTGDSFKTRTGTATKTDKGVKHTNTSYKDDGEADEKSGKGIKSHAKAKDSETKKSERGNDVKLPKHDKPTYGMKNGEKFDNRKQDEAMAEAKKKGDGNLANNAKPYDKVTRGDVIAGRLGKDEKGGKTMKEAKAKCCCEEKGKTKCPVHKPMNEAERTMSRAAKGYEKYGKAGMTALAKAGREGKSLDKIRAKYDKYDESVEADGKEPCPPMSHVKKMCRDGKSVSEICKMHPDCDHTKLKQMVADCKSKMDEASMPMKKVNGKSVPAFAADGKGKHDLSKKKAVKETAAATMWKNVKETTAYMAEKQAMEKKAMKDKKAGESNAFVGALKKAREEGDTTMTVDGKSIPVKPGKPIPESVEVARIRSLMQRLNG